MPPKPRLTHFLCIPLVTPTSRPALQASISRFTSEVTSPNATISKPVALKAIRPVGALHFTLGVMNPLNQERLDEACIFLRSIDIMELLRREEADTVDGSLDEKNIVDLFKMTLSGIHSMQSPSKTSSLYLSPTDAHPALTPFCRKLQAAFRSAGFLEPETRPLKLHAAVIKTVFAREAISGKKRWSKGSGKIEATELMERYKDYEWVKDMRVDRIAICEIGAKKIMAGEEVVDQIYTEVATVPLP